MGRLPPLYARPEACYIDCMTEPTLYTIKLCKEDWLRVIDALRHEAYQMKLESDRACEKGARDYGTLLWEENAILNSISDTIDFALPE